MEGYKRADALEPGDRVITDEDEAAEVTGVAEGVWADSVLVTYRCLGSGHQAAFCVAGAEEILVIR